MPIKCFFCEPNAMAPSALITQDELTYSRWDDFPVGEGHAEVIPKRHVNSYFELTNDEVKAVFEILKETKKAIDQKYSPDSYTIGINDGFEAGQTVPHCHVHLIPRYNGDVANPRGGVRNIIPGKGGY